jgi:hypothetical protein
MMDLDRLEFNSFDNQFGDQTVWEGGVLLQYQAPYNYVIHTLYIYLDSRPRYLVLSS